MYYVSDTWHTVLHLNTVRCKTLFKFRNPQLHLLRVSCLAVHVLFIVYWGPTWGFKYYEDFTAGVAPQ